MVGLSRKAILSTRPPPHSTIFCPSCLMDTPTWKQWTQRFRNKHRKLKPPLQKVTIWDAQTPNDLGQTLILLQFTYAACWDPFQEQEVWRTGWNLSPRTTEHKRYPQTGPSTLHHMAVRQNTPQCCKRLQNRHTCLFQLIHLQNWQGLGFISTHHNSVTFLLLHLDTNFLTILLQTLFRFCISRNNFKHEEISVSGQNIEHLLLHGASHRATAVTQKSLWPNTTCLSSKAL